MQDLHENYKSLKNSQCTQILNYRKLEREERENKITWNSSIKIEEINVLKSLTIDKLKTIINKFKTCVDVVDFVQVFEKMS